MARHSLVSSPLWRLVVVSIITLLSSSVLAMRPDVEGTVESGQRSLVPYNILQAGAITADPPPAALDQPANEQQPLLRQQVATGSRLSYIYYISKAEENRIESIPPGQAVNTPAPPAPPRTPSQAAYAAALTRAHATAQAASLGGYVHDPFQILSADFPRLNVIGKYLHSYDQEIKKRSSKVMIVYGSLFRDPYMIRYGSKKRMEASKGVMFSKCAASSSLRKSLRATLSNCCGAVRYAVKMKITTSEHEQEITTTYATADGEVFKETDNRFVYGSSTPTHPTTASEAQPFTHAEHTFFKGTNEKNQKREVHIVVHHERRFK